MRCVFLRKQRLDRDLEIVPMNPVLRDETPNEAGPGCISLLHNEVSVGPNCKPTPMGLTILHLLFA